MPPKFKRKLIVGLICLISLIWLGINFRSKTPVFWRQETDGITNILFLGASGGEHEGADLTDTMILVSYNRKLNKTFLVSLPRDIWSENLQAKINTAYHYGEEKRTGGGFILAKATATEITGLPIHYALKIDLSGLKKIIDFLGGVTVNIENGFEDDRFPIEGKEASLCNGDPEFNCRYTTVRFAQGRQTLDGERALQYIRSRKAVGEEGTDLARNKRQQNLMLAIKNKISSREVFLNPKTISGLFKLWGQISQSDRQISPWVGLMTLSKPETVHFNNFLYNPETEKYGQWVLAPKSGDFTEIHRYLQKQTQN